MVVPVTSISAPEWESVTAYGLDTR